MAELKNTGVTLDSESETTTEKTYTEAEVKEMLQKEGDRRVTDALKKQAAKFEREKAEAEKMRDMDESQKREYELDKRQNELENKEKELIMAQNKLEASKILAEHGLPSSFVDYVVTDNAETTMNNIKVFEQNWKNAVAAEAQSRLAQPAPKVSTSTEGAISKEAFRKMNLAQQSEIYRTNPELYKILIAR